MRRMIINLRFLSGLTDEEIADLLGIDKHTLYSYMSGRPLEEDHLNRVKDLVELTEYIDRGSASENRKLLRENYALLKEEKYEELKTRVGKGCGRKVITSTTPVDPKYRDKPLPPYILMDAYQDSIPRDVGRSWPARTNRYGKPRKDN